MTLVSVPLKRVASIRVSNVDKKAVEGDVPVRLCNYTDVYYREVIRPDQQFMEATATREQVQAFQLRAGDVVITKDSETAEDIGVPAYVEMGDRDLVCGYHLAIVRPATSVLDGRFLFWSMASTAVREQLSVAATGVTRFGLRTDSISGTAIPYAELSQQRAIADFLDAETARIDALIRRKLDLADLLAERAQAARGHWWETEASKSGTVQLRRLGATVEQGWSPACEGEPAESGQWGVLKTSAVTNGQFDPTKNKRLPAATPPEPRWLVREGDLLVVRGSGSATSVGAVVVAHPGNATLTISDLIYRVRGLNGLPAFFAEALKAPQVRQQIQSTFRTDAGQTLKLRSDDVRDLPVPAVAPKDMPTSFAGIEAVLTRITRAHGQIGRHVELLRERRQALITAAVTGEMKVA